MKYKTRKSLEEIIKTYQTVIGVMEEKANEHNEDKSRAYGGVIRATKGKLQEFITHRLIESAWVCELEQDPERLDINSKKIPIYIKNNYLNSLPNYIREHIEANIDDYYYNLSVDKHVFVDNNLLFAVECKSYTENAMLKRIMVDFMLLKTVFPNLKCFLFQLESMLGGDYSKDLHTPLGSVQSHSIMSYFDSVQLNIFTFIYGERNVDRPINKPEFFKPLEISALKNGLNAIKEVFIDYLK